MERKRLIDLIEFAQASKTSTLDYKTPLRMAVRTRRKNLTFVTNHKISG